MYTMIVIIVINSSHNIHVTLPPISSKQLYIHMGKWGDYILYNSLFNGWTYAASMVVNSIKDTNIA